MTAKSGFCIKIPVNFSVNSKVVLMDDRLCEICHFFNLRRDASLFNLNLWRDKWPGFKISEKNQVEGIRTESCSII